jgi:hypothetical protein
MYYYENSILNNILMLTISVEKEVVRARAPSRYGSTKIMLPLGSGIYSSGGETLQTQPLFLYFLSPLFC